MYAAHELSPPLGVRFEVIERLPIIAANAGLGPWAIGARPAAVAGGLVVARRSARISRSTRP